MRPTSPLVESDIDEESSSTDQSDKEGAGSNLQMLGLCLLGFLMVGVIIALYFWIQLTRPPECRGFTSCPPYPEPYEWESWPIEYDYSGVFPDGFVWGMGTAAYQTEGAYREDGKGASIWDTFTGANTVGMPGANCSYCCKKAPCPISKNMKNQGGEGATGDIACNTYHKYKTDVALMKSMGLKAYRFSISWARVIPTGRIRDGVNKKGIAFYSNLINELLEAGIQPYVTLYHWDLPQGLLDPENGLNAWWSVENASAAQPKPTGQITPDFVDYADLCFKAFGDRVKWWITFNEPWTFLYSTIDGGDAPGIPAYENRWPWVYIAAHNVLNAHAAAVHLYRSKYQESQGGRIGITNNMDWTEPLTKDPQDVAAAERALLFRLGWFTDPIFRGTGDYPEPMRQVFQSFGVDLPAFTEEQKRLIIGSADFFGLNYYSCSFSENDPDPGWNIGGSGWLSAFVKGSSWNLTQKPAPYGMPQAMSFWLYSGAWGFRKMLNWIMRRYDNPYIYITEAGWSDDADTVSEGVHDPMRIEYYANYSAEMHKAIIEDGVNVKGFFAWSFMDNFEWSAGYKPRFGLIRNEYNFGPTGKKGPIPGYPQPRVGQVRWRKNSSCYLEAVWRANQLINPFNGSFLNCINEDTRKVSSVYA